MICSAGMIGWLASIGNPLLAAIPPILVIGILVALRAELLFWSVVIGGLMVSGLTRLYVPPLEQVRWLLAPASLVLLAHGLARYLGDRRSARGAPMPTILWWAFGFIAATLVSTAASGFSLDRFVIGLKGYFQVWPLLFALALVPWPAKVMDRLPKVLLLIAVAQLPFVLHQLLVLVPARAGLGNGIVPIDVVAGTFGASLEGGGANAILNAFLVIVLAGLVAGRQQGIVSARQLWLLGGLLIAPVLVNEAKVSVLYLLAAFFVLFGRDFARRPLRFLATGLAMILLIGGLLAAYTLNSPEHEDINSLHDLLVYTYEYNVEEDEIGGRLSRFGALELWAQMHSSGNWKDILLGHGIGYTRVADPRAFPAGTVVASIRGVPVHLDLESDIGNTAVTALLWETGVLGLVSFVALLAATYRIARRLEPVYADHPERVSMLRAIRVGMLIIFITLLHKNLLVLDVVYQTLVILMVGYVAYWDRYAALVGADARRLRPDGECAARPEGSA